MEYQFKDDVVITEKNEAEEFNKDLKEIREFIQSVYNDPKDTSLDPDGTPYYSLDGSLVPESLINNPDVGGEFDGGDYFTYSRNINEEELEIIADKIMKKYKKFSAEDRDEIINTLRSFSKKQPSIKTQPKEKIETELPINTAQETRNKYIKRITGYKTAKEFDSDKQFRNQADTDLTKAIIEYSKEIKKLREKLNALPMSALKEKNTIKGTLAILEREYQEVQEMQSIVRKRPKVASDIDPNSKMGEF